ncbi:MAG: SPOR domain-containing protein [Bacteroidota bacterium]
MGINTGLISYYGDVGSLDGLSKQAEMNWGTSISLISPLTDGLDLKAFAFFGSITQEERLVGGNANFTSPIRMGGLTVSYNFNHFLPEDRTIQPYVSLGISTFEFNPKTDLLDAQGRAYNYWSDGTIRNIAESAENAFESILLERDFTYESDLRATGENSGLPYALRGVTMPIGAGVNLKINDFFSLNMSTEFHYSFTDNLDDITESSNGRSGNDHFMFSSIGLVYNLEREKKSNSMKGLEFEFDHLEFEDEDSDGIADIIDLCPFTQEDVAVDNRGCPIDTDGDGIPDYLDEDLMSPEGTLVNLQGGELTDADILNIFQTYKDSIGTLSYQKSKTSTEDFERQSVKIRERGKGYRVKIIDTDNLDGIAISKLLSISDIRGSENGNETSYFLGDFNSLEEAYSRTRYLEEMNFETELVYNDFGQFEAVEQSEIDRVKESTESFYANPNETTFRVQIGAYRYRLSQDIFNGVEGVLVITGQDGLTRYISGSFSTIKEAAEHRIELLLKGFEGSFVTAYKGGKRISLQDAGARVSKEEKIEATPQTGGINAKFVSYTIQVGAFSGRVPADMLGKFFELKDVRPMRSSNGMTKYVYKAFETKEEAEAILDELRKGQFEDAQIVGLFNGQVISQEEADRLKSE